MKSSSVASRPVVIDASFAVVAVLPLPATAACQERLAAWYDEGRTLLAPDPWVVEVVSALRRLQSLKKVSPEELTQAVKDLFELDVETVLQAELWTVDERLGNRARQLGADWVRVARGLLSRRCYPARPGIAPGARTA